MLPDLAVAAAVVRWAMERVVHVTRRGGTAALVAFACATSVLVTACSSARTAGEDRGGGRRVAPEPVTFTTRDGGVIRGHLYGMGERGVVLAHGGRFNK